MKTPVQVRVRDVMNERYILVDGLDTVRKALDTLRERGAHCILVDKRDPSDE